MARKPVKYINFVDQLLDSEDGIKHLWPKLPDGAHAPEPQGGEGGRTQQSDRQGTTAWLKIEFKKEFPDAIREGGDFPSEENFHKVRLIRVLHMCC